MLVTKTIYMTDLKPGDLVVHKAALRLDMTVYYVNYNENTVTCHYWNSQTQTFIQAKFDPAELLKKG